MYEEWERKEGEFHLEQVRLRNQIRIREGRAKPIDILAKYINSLADTSEIELNEPYLIFTNLSMIDCEDLLEDIKVYMQLDGEAHLDFWRDMMVICEDELERRRRETTADGAAASAPLERNIHPQVLADVHQMLSNKSHEELCALREQLEAKINSSDPGNISYWEALHAQLRVFLARARIRSLHERVLKDKLEQLQSERGAEGAHAYLDALATEQRELHNQMLAARDSAPGADAERGAKAGAAAAQVDDVAADVFTEGQLMDGLGPQLIPFGSLEPSEEACAVDADDEWRALLEKRQRVLHHAHPAAPRILPDDSGAALAMERAFQAEMDKHAEENEGTFREEVALPQQLLAWHDKYRPRKPRYFNRVHTGWEWNKYNQTHYDHDNPPPKMVQGYKFNIFYPDLIDKSKAPSYKITPDPSNPDFCILRFIAGPPYEDLAFKVVNRNWEYSHKHGFRCSVDRGIFHLWFHFRRERYRR